MLSSLYLTASHLTALHAIAGMNMLVCTPGRLLQHMDETLDYERALGFPHCVCLLTAVHTFAGMNMLVCTPGRLLQHMDETPGFDASQLQALVLDEADRILDMGFSATLNAILENLPRHRQTMLFSATQTKSVKDLARLSLDAPENIAVHFEAAMPTPVKLQQVRMSLCLFFLQTRHCLFGCL